MNLTPEQFEAALKWAEGVAAPVVVGKYEQLYVIYEKLTGKGLSGQRAVAAMVEQGLVPRGEAGAAYTSLRHTAWRRAKRAAKTISGALPEARGAGANKTN